MLAGPIRTEAMIIHAKYAGVWMLGCSQAGEDHALPWPVRIEPGSAATCSYSVVLVVDAPDGAGITVIKGSR
jgi:hypothetical protein